MHVTAPVLRLFYPSWEFPEAMGVRPVIIGAHTQLTHSPRAAPSCRNGGDHLAPPLPAWPAGTPGVSAEFGRGCSASACLSRRKRSQDETLEHYIIIPLILYSPGWQVLEVQPCLKGHLVTLHYLHENKGQGVTHGAQMVQIPKWATDMVSLGSYGPQDQIRKTHRRIHQTRSIYL